MIVGVPTSSNNYIAVKVYKTIITEHYVQKGLELLGTIGGKLGLMIGFSFMGTITSIVELVIGLKANYCSGG